MSFHPFPRLPLELREMIWVFALPGPQFITISTKSFSNLSNTGFDDRLRVYYTEHEVDNDIIIQGASDTIKSLYLTCKESHATVNRCYCRILSDRLPHPVIFDPGIDSIYFSDCNAVKLFLQSTNTSNQDSQSADTLAMSMPVGPQFGLTNAQNVFKLIRRFSKAKRIVFVNRTPKLLKESQLRGLRIFPRQLPSQTPRIFLCT